MRVNDWVERMHPDDREYVVDFCVSQSRAGVDHEADYRALTHDGDYVWIRDVVHVVRKDGEVEALVGFMFDISERKKTEEQLMRLQKQLEEFSFKDGLTGIANRRMFDTVMEREWSSAQRTGSAAVADHSGYRLLQTIQRPLRPHQGRRMLAARGPDLVPGGQPAAGFHRADRRRRVRLAAAGNRCRIRTAGGTQMPASDSSAADPS